MREMLCKGKRVDNGEWVEGYFVGAGVCMIIPQDAEHWGGVDFNEGYIVDPETAGQYTGLIDKHDKRIFEGDIVRYWDGKNCFTAQVVFECGAFGIARRPELPISFPHACNNDNFMSLWELIWNQEYLEPNCVDLLRVIGNVHDNPELLTNEKAGE